MKLRARLALLFALACAVLGGFGAGGAFAATPAAGYAVSDWATGMANCGFFCVGPVGLASDPNSPHDIYVMNYWSGNLYEYKDAAGGVEGPSALVGPVTDSAAMGFGWVGNGNAAGIAFDKDGKLYVALQSWSRTAEIDKTNGQIIRYLHSPMGDFGDGTGWFPGATGIATDPLSGDIFVSVLGNAGVTAVRVPTIGVGGSVYYGPGLDGITFGPDGTLWGEGGGTVWKIDGTNKATVGSYAGVAYVDQGDGISVAAASDNPALPPYVFVNSNNGIITKVDLSGPSPVYSDVVTGGSRGDFSTVGYDGCLYATQTDEVIKVTNADGSCSLAPVTPDDATALAVSAPASDDFNDTISVSATLNNVSKATTIAGQTVAFTLDSASCSAVTTAAGVATCSLTIADAAGPATLTAHFDHQPKLAPATTTAPFTITLEETTLTYTGVSGSIVNGSTATLSGVLKEDGTTPLAGRTVSFTLGSGGSAQSCVGTTSGTGAASCSVVVSQAAGTQPITAAYAGDAYYVSAAASAAVNVIVSARAIKQNALDALNALNAANACSTSKGKDGRFHDDEDCASRFSSPIRKVAKSLNPAWWAADGIHLTLNGCGVFDNEQAAASQLLELLHSKKLNAAQMAAIQGVIDQLVQADQILATTAVNEATAHGSAKKLALANKALAKAAALLARGQSDDAIDQYRVAWEKAQESQGRRVCGDDGHEDEDGHDGGHHDNSDS